MDACIQKTVDDSREIFGEYLERVSLLTSAEYGLHYLSNKTSEDRYR